MKTKKYYKRLKEDGVLNSIMPSLTGDYEDDKKAFKYAIKMGMITNPLISKVKSPKVESKNPVQYKGVNTFANQAENTNSLKFDSITSEIHLDGPRECIIGNKFQDQSFLFKYLNSHSPSGYEGEGQKVWVDYMKSIGYTTCVDGKGNALSILYSEHTSDINVLIEAHADEISYVVTKISEKGIIYVMRNGGSDESIAPSKKVIIHTTKGRVDAVFGWIAVHIRDKTIIPEARTIFLDAGFDSKEAVLLSGVQVGDQVTYNDTASILNDKLIGKSLDNKVGGYVISQVAKRIIDRKGLNNFNLMISNSTQEEVGLKGVKVMMEGFKIDLAIVTDVTHDTSTPGIVNNLIGDIQLGRGPVLVKGPAINSNFLELTKNLAKEAGIEYQNQAHSGRGTGTDADVISYSGDGVATILIKMPQRYMHTTVEMCSIDDINKTIDLMTETLIKLDENPISIESILEPNRNAY